MSTDIDKAGNMTNPLESYVYKSKNAGHGKTHLVAEYSSYEAVLHGQDIQLGKDASNFEDVPNGSKVSSPSATPPKAQDSKGTTISK